MAQQRTSEQNQEVWAGIGWIQDPKTKKGLLVEHEGNSEKQVRADIRNTLVALGRNRRVNFGEPQMHVVGANCTNKPVCALVVAVFQSTVWKTSDKNDFLKSIEFAV